MIKGVFSYAEAFSSDILMGKTLEEKAKTLKGIGIENVILVEKALENEELVKALEKSGISVFSELMLFLGPKYWNEKQESRPVMASGKLYEREDWYAGVCPNQEWILEKKLEEVGRFLKRYPLEGIILDFIRFVAHWGILKDDYEQNCFCPVCLGLFQEETGISVPEGLAGIKGKADWIIGNHEKEWINWKCRCIYEIVKRVRSVVGQEMTLGAFSVPWLKDEFNGGIRRVVGQDYTLLGKVVDMISPMAYHKKLGKPAEWIATLSEEAREGSGVQVWPILSDPVSGEWVQGEERQRVIDVLKRLSPERVFFFSLKNVLDKPEDLEEFGKILKEI